MGASLLLSQWTDTMNLLYTVQCALWITSLCDMLSVSKEISVRYESTCEEMRQNGADSPTITSRSSAARLSHCEPTGSISAPFSQLCQQKVSHCVAEFHCGLCYWCQHLTLLKDRRKNISNWEKTAQCLNIDIHYVTMHILLWVNMINIKA